MPAQSAIGVCDRLDRVRLPVDRKAIEDAVRVEVLGEFPDGSTLWIKERHLVGHPALAWDIGNGLGVVQCGDGVERRSQQQHFSARADKPFQRRIPTERLTKPMRFDQRLGERPDCNH